MLKSFVPLHTGEILRSAVCTCTCTSSFAFSTTNKNLTGTRQFANTRYFDAGDNEKKCEEVTSETPVTSDNCVKCVVSGP